MSRRHDGDETYHRLIQWTKRQKAAELLCGHILRADGFESVDPIHPLGGRDGLKDLIASRDGLRYVCGVYFPSEQKNFNDVRKKFLDDLRGVVANGANAFAFCTNQKLTDGQRKQLGEIDPYDGIDVGIYPYAVAQLMRLLTRARLVQVRTNDSV